MNKLKLHYQIWQNDVHVYISKIDTFTDTVLPKPTRSVNPPVLSTFQVSSIIKSNPLAIDVG